MVEILELGPKKGGVSLDPGGIDCLCSKDRPFRWMEAGMGAVYQVESERLTAASEWCMTTKRARRAFLGGALIGGT